MTSGHSGASCAALTGLTRSVAEGLSRYCPTACSWQGWERKPVSRPSPTAHVLFGAVHVAAALALHCRQTRRRQCLPQTRLQSPAARKQHWSEVSPTTLDRTGCLTVDHVADKTRFSRLCRAPPTPSSRRLLRDSASSLRGQRVAGRTWPKGASMAGAHLQDQ